MSACECGCGGRPLRADSRYCRGHNPRGNVVMAAPRDDIPHGLCLCGCGQQAPLATRTRPSRGQAAGEPISYVRGHNNRGRSPFDFESYDAVDLGYSSACWVYRRQPTSFGYVQMRIPGGGMVQAHRAFFEQHRGPIPEGMTLDHVCHTATTSCPGGTDCVHRRCVNPAHLEPMPRSENARLGRSVKLSALQIDDIRYLTAAGWRTSAIADAYGVSRAAINHIKRGSTWANV